MKLALTIVALVLDSLCLALMAAVFLVSHSSDSAKLGVALIATVILANLPALIWNLVPRKQPDASATAAGIFS